MPFAVNVAAAEASETVRPYLAVGEQLGTLFAGLVAAEGLPSKIEIEYQGELAGYDTRILTLSVLKGVFSAGSDEPVSFVNAPQLAEERGIQIAESSSSSSIDWINLVSIAGGGHRILDAAARANPGWCRSTGTRSTCPVGQPHPRATTTAPG